MIEQQAAQKAFERMGARVKFLPPHRFQEQDVAIDIGRDRNGEFFEFRQKAGDPPEVLQVLPELRHLLLMVRDGRNKNKYLCGHDERHWFVAAIPGASVRNVATAIESLNPVGREGFIRQGEWFFVPVSHLDESSEVIYGNEPLSRGRGSKPHYCEEILRRGGTPVMVHRRHAPEGLTLPEYEKFLQEHPDANPNQWVRMVRDAEVYARGWVRHADHRTKYLDGWHRVHLNRERFAAHARHIAFLD